MMNHFYLSQTIMLLLSERQAVTTASTAACFNCCVSVDLQTFLLRQQADKPGSGVYIPQDPGFCLSSAFPPSLTSQLLTQW